MYTGNQTQFSRFLLIFESLNMSYLSCYTVLQISYTSFRDGYLDIFDVFEYSKPYYMKEIRCFEKL